MSSPPSGLDVARVLVYLLPVPTRFLPLAACGLLTLAGCGGERAGQSLGDFALLTPVTASTTLLRMPDDGGVPTLYRAPTLAEVPWARTPDALPALRRPIGTDLDQRLVFALDRDKQIVGLDLETGKVNVFVEDVFDAFLAPDGALFTVGTDSSVTELHRRTPSRWGRKMVGTPQRLFGTLQHDVVAVLTGAPQRLVVVRSDNDPSVVDLPDGPTAVSSWGDLLAIAADSALVVLNPKDDRPPRTIDIPGAARAVAFSPAGNRIYVSGSTKRLVEVDRDTEKTIGRITLPGAPQALRSSLYGGWVMARPAGVDSIWLVDVAAGKFLGTIAGAWADDLPVIIGDIALVRQGDDVVALDLTDELFPEVERIVHGAVDFYLPLGWSPEAPSGPDETPEDDQADEGGDSPRIYLQVSSSQNPKWAEDFAARLSAAGLSASVMAPRQGEEGYRVVIGPYLTREEADSVGRELGAPYFIYQPRTP